MFKTICAHLRTRAKTIPPEDQRRQSVRRVEAPRTVEGRERKKSTAKWSLVASGRPLYRCRGGTHQQARTRPSTKTTSTRSGHEQDLTIGGPPARPSAVPSPLSILAARSNWRTVSRYRSISIAFAIAAIFVPCRFCLTSESKDSGQRFLLGEATPATQRRAPARQPNRIIILHLSRIQQDRIRPGRE